MRSFVLRQPTEGREKLDRSWPKYGLSRDNGMIDPREVFGRDNMLNLEIGFGMGRSLADMAEAAPEQDFIGVEVHLPGVGALLKDVEDRGLENVRVYNIDANDVIDLCLPDASLDRVMIFFPDPWHKKKHHKRRLIQPEFIQRIRHKLRVGGVLHLATDWENYAEHMLEVMNDSEGFANPQEQGVILRARMTARSPSSSSVARNSATVCGTCCSIAPTDLLPRHFLSPAA